MTTISLRQVPDFVSRRQSFKCNRSLYAEHLEKGYAVFSYGEHFPVAVYDKQTGIWAFNTDRYSPTTSRHQSKVKQGVYGVISAYHTTEEMRQLVAALH